MLLCSWHPCLSCWIFFDFGDGKQRSVPCKWKIILTYSPVGDGFVGSNVDGYVDSSCEFVPLPAYGAESAMLCYGLCLVGIQRCVKMLLDVS